MILKLNVSLFLKTGIILFLMGFSQVFAQQDSIDNLLKIEKDSEKKIDILLNSSNYFSGKEIALRLSRQAYQLALDINNNELIGQAAKQLFIELYAADKKDSVSFYQEIAINKFKIAHNDNSLFQVLIKKFRFSRNQQKPEVAFEVYKELIVLAEKLDDPLKIADVYYNMGGLFKDIVAPDKSILYYNKALNLYTKLNNWNGVDDCYLNIGLGYSLKGHYDMAIEYYERGLKIDAEKNNNTNRADLLSGIGNVYFALANNKKALDYYKQALACFGKNDNKKAVYLKNNIGVVLMDLEQYKEAKPYLIEVFFSTDDPRTKADYAFNLAQLYEMMGDYRSSIDYMDKYVRMNDSLNSIMYAKNLSESEAKYQNEKKEEQNLILKEHLKNKSLQIYFALAGILLLLILAFFIFRGLRQKNKANKALAEKNKIIEEKSLMVEEKSLIVEEQHKDITDSIKYAQRIQRAILPPDKLWNDMLPDSFVFYQPKDILSGDFYWIEETTEYIFIAAADCTGHGVPGALMSIVNYNLLNKAVLEQELIDAGKILDSVNKLLTQSLHQTFQESAVRDGMDISLCVIHKATKKLNFAGAFNSIYIIRSNEIIELTPDKKPVGAFIEDNIKPFTNKYFQLMENDVVYMFTDGYADQFGGENGKKFKYKNLQHLLLEIHHKPFSEQKKIASNWINDWKGNLEQIDDILLLGYKMS